MRLKTRVMALYEANSPDAHRFRYGLLAVDVVTVLLLLASTFDIDGDWVFWVDIAVGLYVLLDYAARFWIAGRKIPFVMTPLNIIDMVVLVSLVAPLVGGNFAFLRSLRILRLLRSYRLQRKLRQDVALFRQHEDVILSGINLFVFVFVMTELVYVSQARVNPEIGNFLDALYFTIATLTTTGFGDVTLVGEGGRILAILIMVFGVSLFLRLIQTIFRPAKVRFTCQACGLFLHENDAVHCKHCGAVLNIPSDGDV
jgi:voltage-gated potassium channel